MQHPVPITHKRYIGIAALLYFLLGGFILFKYGIQLGGEAEKYIDNANRILRHDTLRNGIFGIFYFTYSVIVAFFIHFSLPLNGVAILQLVLSFLAGWCLYRLLLDLLQKEGIALLFFLAYLFCYPIQKWNFYLYSESLHTSLLMIATYLLYRALHLNTFKAWLAVGLLCLAVAFSRPVGVIFLAATALVLIAVFYRTGRIRLALLGLAISLAGLIAVANSPLAAFVNPDAVRRMEVICQVPQEGADTSYTEFNRSGLMSAFRVIKNEVGIGKFTGTGFSKLGAFYGMYRPYYSWYSNLLLLFYLVFYPFAIMGIFKRREGLSSSVKLLSITYLLFTSLAIFVTCDDWANRFISPAFPFILLLSAMGAGVVATKFMKRAAD